MRNFLAVFIFFCSFSFGQQIEAKLKSTILKMDSLMQHNDEKIIEIFAEDVSFGHSNGWTQNKADFIKDFNSKKVLYQKIKNDEFLEVKGKKKLKSVRRIIEVQGKYKEYPFQMKLSTLEFWKKIKGNWKLWSRQSVELKP